MEKIKVTLGCCLITKYKNMEIPMKEIVKQFSGKENNYLTIKEKIEVFLLGS